MDPNMINRLVGPCSGSHFLLSLPSLYHFDTDHVPINPFSYFFHSQKAAVDGSIV